MPVPCRRGRINKNWTELTTCDQDRGNVLGGAPDLPSSVVVIQWDLRMIKCMKLVDIGTIFSRLLRSSSYSLLSLWSLILDGAVEWLKRWNDWGLAGLWCSPAEKNLHPSHVLSKKKQLNPALVIDSWQTASLSCCDSLQRLPLFSVYYVQDEGSSLWFWIIDEQIG